MKKKLLAIIVAATLLLTIVLTGCSSGGVAQADYDKLQAQLTDTQNKLTKALADLDAAKAVKPTSTTVTNQASAELDAARAQITDLQKQIAALKAANTLTGTTMEIATKLVKAYKDSHFYIRDNYDCNNYAADFWDMLKLLKIDSVIVVGNRDTLVTDILNVNHAWVMVDVGSGQKVAFDPTTGESIAKDKNPLYYVGWTFKDPAGLKANDDLKTEYNTRLAFRNALNDEVKKAADLHDAATNQADEEKYLALYNKLNELKAAQETILTNLMGQINALAIKL